MDIYIGGYLHFFLYTIKSLIFFKYSNDIIVRSKLYNQIQLIDQNVIIYKN